MRRFLSLLCTHDRLFSFEIWIQSARGLLRRRNRHKIRSGPLQKAPYETHASNPATPHRVSSSYIRGSLYLVTTSLSGERRVVSIILAEFSGDISWEPCYKIFRRIFFISKFFISKIFWQNFFLSKIFSLKIFSLKIFLLKFFFSNFFWKFVFFFQSKIFYSCHVSS